MCIALLTVGDERKLTKATNDSNSLRVTVPPSVVNSLKLSEGDYVEWEIDIRDSELVAFVKPIKNKRKEEK